MVYEEKQSMKQLWWVLIPTSISIIMVFTFWLGADDPAEKQELLTALIITLVVELAVVLLFFSMILRTRVDSKGVTFSFKPFLRNKNYTWADIEKVWVRKYKPIREYGGWGFRGSFFGGKGKAYNVWGNKGLQLHLKNGKKVLIGTQKHEELAVFLKRLKEKHEIPEIGKEELNS